MSRRSSAPGPRSRSTWRSSRWSRRARATRRATGSCCASTDDLSGSFGYYAAYNSNGVGQRNEQNQPATIDADDAPRYLITVDYLSHGYEDGVDGEEAAPGQPGVAAGRIELARPNVLRARQNPQAAGDKAVFDCMLSDDRLDCTLTGAGDGSPEIWKFARQLEET